ncbi:MAG: ATP-binding cassette domain-containing protein [Eubacteriales bacterium]|nr:ATP-binding cassette domain-containing protein [Eubacteriales bacterium]
MAYIEISGIMKSYGKNHILKGAGFYAEQGECIGIVGANGCGKSTLLGIISGSHKPDGGAIAYGGENPLKNRKVFSQFVGYVPQENPLMDNLSVYDNLRFWYCDSKRKLKEDLINGVPAMLGVSSYLDKNVAKLSGGMKKRLSIACAFAKNPPILIMDEPGASLDIVCKQDIKNYLQWYNKNGGTVIITSHEETELRLCNRMYLLNDGRLEQLTGRPAGNELMDIIRKKI